MEAIEIIVYIFVAMAVSAVVLGFLIGFDFAGTQKSVLSLFKADDNVRFESVSPSEFVGKMISFKQNCEETDEFLNLTLHLKNETLTKSIFFDYVDELYLCKSFQSLDEGCGVGEFFTRFDDVHAGDIFTVECLGPQVFMIEVLT